MKMFKRKQLQIQSKMVQQPCANPKLAWITRYDEKYLKKNKKQIEDCIHTKS